MKEGTRGSVVSLAWLSQVLLRSFVVCGPQIVLCCGVLSFYLPVLLGSQLQTLAGARVVLSGPKGQEGQHFR